MRIVHRSKSEERTTQKCGRTGIAGKSKRSFGIRILRTQSVDQLCHRRRSNGQRVVRAFEVCLMTGKPFSSFKTSSRKARQFEVEKIGLTRPREVLYDRINRRVLQMVDEGLVDEVRGLVKYRDLAALQTVGYKEIFDWFDFQDGLVTTEGWTPTTPGDGPVTSLDRAVELIQRNTRRYAKRQLSYWGRDKDIRWMEL